MSAQTPNVKVGRACSHCNQKKIKCKFSKAQRPCDSCSELHIECIPRTRKKRRPVIPRSPHTNLGLDSQSADNHTQQYQNWDSVESTWGLTEPHVPTQLLTPSRVASGTSWPSDDGTLMITTDNTTHDNSLASNHIGSTAHRNQQSISDISSKDTHLNTATYVGRSHYIAQDAPIDETSARAYRAFQNEEPSEMELQTLNLWHSLDLPPRAARQSLLDTYMQRCFPWTPILNPLDLESKDGRSASLLLTQAVYLAASRVSSAPGVIAYASSEQFYQRAKTLFWLGHEKDPLIAIAATIMLHWYNPDGPEHVSFDTSRFWIQIGAGLASQVGLHKEPSPGPEGIVRRRLWWSLVARDCLISAGQGRPRTINLKDSDVRAPRYEDFPDSRSEAELFIPYVEICILLGELTEFCLRKHISSSKQKHLESSLYRWTRELPRDLRMSYRSNDSEGYVVSAYNLNARQLHVPYFITLVILGRSTASHGHVSSVALLASSFITSIFEDFLARDEIQFLGPIFTFYLLAAGVALLSIRRYSELWKVAQQDLALIQNSLQELSKRWPSAVGAIKALHNSMEASIVSEAKEVALPALEWLDSEGQLLFEGFPTEICKLWIPLKKHVNGQYTSHDHARENPSSELATAEILGNLRYPLPARDLAPMPIPQFGGSGGDSGDALGKFQYDGIGNWLLTDWAAEILPW